MSPTPAPSPPPDPFLAQAEGLLGPTLEDPVPRALRIAGLYAAFFLEEPFQFRWGGIACFVSWHIHKALQAPDLGVDDALFGVGVHEVLADANLTIFRNVVPAWLRFRAGVPVKGPMGEGFDRLRAADERLLREPAWALAEMEEATCAFCRVEQEEVVQPRLARLPRIVQDGLAPLYQFRLGWDTAAPVIRFHGDNPADLAQRWAWTIDEVLPRYHAWLATHAEEHRADCDRLRRRAGVRLEHLPPRRPPGPVTEAAEAGGTGGTGAAPPN